MNLEEFLKQKYTVKNIILDRYDEKIIFEFIETTQRLQLYSDNGYYEGEGYFYGNDFETLEETLSGCTGNRIISIDSSSESVPMPTLSNRDDDYDPTGTQISIYLENHEFPVDFYLVQDTYYGAYLTIDII